MTRFEQELSGQLGEFWVRHAKEEIMDYQERADNGEILLDENGGAYWKSSGNYLPSDCAERLSYTAFKFSIEATDAGRDKQSADFLKEYREQMKNYKPSEEELAEMRAAFGPGEKIVDIFTGKVVAYI